MTSDIDFASKSAFTPYASRVRDRLIQTLKKQPRLDQLKVAIGSNPNDGVSCCVNVVEEKDHFSFSQTEEQMRFVPYQDARDARLIRFYERHHPDSSFFSGADEVKNKNHVSVTGGTGNSAMFRKVSFSSCSPISGSDGKSFKLTPPFINCSILPINVSSLSYPSNFRYSPTLQQQTISPTPFFHVSNGCYEEIFTTYPNSASYILPQPCKKVKVNDQETSMIFQKVANYHAINETPLYDPVTVEPNIEKKVSSHAEQQASSCTQNKSDCCFVGVGMKRKFSESTCAIHHPAIPDKSVPVAQNSESRQQSFLDPQRRTSSLSTSSPHKPINPKRSVHEKYHIHKKMGAGGCGVVYAASRKSDNFGVAIKRIPKKGINRWGKINGKVVPQEFELLHRAGKSGHNSIIKMYEWYEHRNSYVLVMERPQPALDLFDSLQQQQITEPYARNLFRQLVTAVMACHRVGVVHRDIKDENVLLNLHTDEVKLIDFGCGTFDQEKPLTDFAGTKEFYPPEWFLHHQYNGRDLDTWSLGVLLYTMVQSQIPFQTPLDIVNGELTYNPNRRPSPLCCDLIESILKKDPRDRYTLVEIMQHPWMTDISRPPFQPFMTFDQHRKTNSEAISESTPLERKVHKDEIFFTSPSANQNQEVAYSPISPSHSNSSIQEDEDAYSLNASSLVFSNQESENNYSPTVLSLENADNRRQDMKKSYNNSLINSSAKSPPLCDQINISPKMFVPTQNGRVIDQSQFVFPDSKCFIQKVSIATAVPFQNCRPLFSERERFISEQIVSC